MAEFATLVFSQLGRRQVTNEDADWSIKTNLLAMSGAALGLQTFATKLIAASRNSGPLGDGDIKQIKADTILDAENSEVFGFPMKGETDILCNALKLLEYFIDAAISAAVVE